MSISEPSERDLETAETILQPHAVFGRFIIRDVAKAIAEAREKGRREEGDRCAVIPKARAHEFYIDEFEPDCPACEAAKRIADEIKAGAK